MRTARKRSEADIYHVVARGAGRQIIFEDSADRKRFLNILDNALEESSVEILAWCLMSNHVHLLLHAPIESISAAMHRVLGSYALYFNAKSGRVGHLFQGRFSSEPIDSDSYLLTVIRYIHQNPVKAGLSSVLQWPWSSYAEYISEPIRCATVSLLDIFGGKEAFERFHMALANDQCLDISEGRSSTRGYSDEKAAILAQEVLGEIGLGDLKSLEPQERNQYLVRLRKVGLTIRQIERLTGIGRGTIQRVAGDR